MCPVNGMTLSSPLILLARMSQKRAISQLSNGRGWHPSCDTKPKRCSMICQDRLFGSLLLVCAVLITGCGKGNPGWASFPVTIYSDAQINQSSSAQADFQDAMAFWEAKAGKKLFDYKGEWTGGTPYTGTATAPGNILANVIFFQNPWPFSANIVGQTTTIDSSSSQIQSAMVMINATSALCSQDCTNDNYSSSERKAFTHELGHFLGLVHVQDTANIMYPSLTPGGSLENETIDTAAFQALTTAAQ
jgi:hypothetical protein